MTETIITLVVINIMLGVIVLIMGVILSRELFNLYKKQRIALFIGNDKRPMGMQVISPKGETFIDSDKNRYNIGEPQISFGRKEFVLYRYNKADPIDIFDKENSRLDGDVYQAIFENEVAKALNRINTFGNLNWKKLILFGILGIVGFVILKSVLGG